MWNTSQSLTTPQTWLPWQTRHWGQKYIWILIVNVNSIVPIYNTHNKYIHMSSKCIAMYTSIHISIVRTDYIMLWFRLCGAVFGIGYIFGRFELHIWTLMIILLDLNGAPGELTYHAMAWYGIKWYVVLSYSVTNLSAYITIISLLIWIELHIWTMRVTYMDDECYTSGRLHVCASHVARPLTDMTKIYPHDSHLFLSPFFLFCFIVFSWYLLILSTSFRFTSLALGIIRFPQWLLTHGGPDKMAAIFQTTFSNAFSWIKMYQFRLQFHRDLYPMV